MKAWLVTVAWGDPTNPQWSAVVHAYNETADGARAAVAKLFADLQGLTGVQAYGEFTVTDVRTA